MITSDLTKSSIEVDSITVSPRAKGLTLYLTREILKIAVMFSLLWLAFYGAYAGLPYLSSGASLIYRAKLNYETHERLFPSSGSKRVLIFGNSKVLAGFVPDEFDRLAAGDSINTSSFNSGYPGLGDFVAQLEDIVQRGQAPNVLLLTVPWHVASPKQNVFRFATDDKAIAEYLFPFRYLPRDALSFLFTSRQHGGLRKFYAESKGNVASMLRDRGYYFISEQSRFKGDKLPDDFRLPSDAPNMIQSRSADTRSPELSELNTILHQHHVECYFVPSYSRMGEAAPAPSQDLIFVQQVESNSSCKVLGPDYLSFPNSYFSDQTHVNHAGASAYTRALYSLVAKYLRDSH
jgi:hypothetical protein